MWSSVIFNTIGTVLRHLKIKLPTAYSTEAEASDTSVASILHHDLLNCEEPVTVWYPSPKSRQPATVLLEICKPGVSTCHSRVSKVVLEATVHGKPILGFM